MSPHMKEVATERYRVMTELSYAPRSCRWCPRDHPTPEKRVWGAHGASCFESQQTSIHAQTGSADRLYDARMTYVLKVASLSF